jgi:hypothetical protein
LNLSSYVDNHTALVIAFFSSFVMSVPLGPAWASDLQRDPSAKASHPDLPPSATKSLSDPGDGRRRIIAKDICHRQI